ncbi:MAG: hypothetical protein U9N40_04055 [Euryarchaeota archaeon]|nr:hypothetical protein [Euryarchaeota archaeon]
MVSDLDFLDKIIEHSKLMVSDLLSKMIEDSKYEGESEFTEILNHAKTAGMNGFAVYKNVRKSYVLIFIKGEVNGAILIDENGMLFGDKVLYLLEKSGIYKLYSTPDKISDSIVACCRIYEKNHIYTHFSRELPSIGTINREIMGKLRILIKSGDQYLQGMKVTIKRGKQIITTDFTTIDGSVSFRILNGNYDCIVINREKQSEIFKIDFSGRDSEIEIDLNRGK